MEEHQHRLRQRECVDLGPVAEATHDDPHGVLADRRGPPGMSMRMTRRRDPSGRRTSGASVVRHASISFVGVGPKGTRCSTMVSPSSNTFWNTNSTTSRVGSNAGVTSTTTFAAAARRSTSRPESR
jgi:hypothetical protein